MLCIFGPRSSSHFQVARTLRHEMDLSCTSITQEHEKHYELHIEIVAKLNGKLLDQPTQEF